MGLYLEITNGKSKGAKFPLKEGARMGRTTGEIIISDPKISSLHAQIEKNHQNELVLSDRNSANGLWIGGNKTSSILLLPGVSFRAGRTTFQVVQIDQDLESTQLKVGNSILPAKDWKEVLSNEVPNLHSSNSEDLILVNAFDPPVRLDFIEGIQYKQFVVLGFGPRKFGSESFDVEIYDPESPALAFTITPDEGQAKYATKEYRSVLLNDKQLTSCLLKTGDIIKIGKTLIRVSFVEDERS